MLRRRRKGKFEINFARGHKGIQMRFQREIGIIIIILLAILSVLFPSLPLLEIMIIIFSLKVNEGFCSSPGMCVTNTTSSNIRREHKREDGVQNQGRSSKKKMEVSEQNGRRCSEGSRGKHHHHHFDHHPLPVPLMSYCL